MFFPSQPESGKLIRKTRLEKGWTQKQLAEMVGINQAHIAKIEAGTSNTKGNTLAAIYEALDIQFVVKDARYEINSRLEMLVQETLDAIRNLTRKLGFR